MAVYPAKFTVHKGKQGAFQGSPMPPTWESEPAKDKEGKLVKDKNGNQIFNQKVIKEGAVLIEMAPFKEERDGNLYYDWTKKVSFALGVPDVCKIASEMGNKFSLVHSTDAGTKSMQFTPGEGQYAGTMNIWLTHKKDDQVVGQAKISMSEGEFLIFVDLLKQTTAPMLGWDEVSGRT